MAPLHHTLERAQFYQRLHSRLYNCLRRIRVLGLWSSIWISVAATSMVKRLGTNRHNGEGASTNCFKMRYFWEPLLSGSRVEFHCDNSSVVNSITKGSSKEIMVMHLLRCLWFFSAHFDIKISACHIPGTLNTATDQLSRNRSTEFLKLHPYTCRSPASIPTSLLKLISPRRQDCTSPSFLRHFKRTINTLQGSPPARNKKSHT